MPASQTKLIKRCAQWIPKAESRRIPPATRGIYALLQNRRGTKKYDVVYIGMTSRSSVGRRLARHKNDKKKIWSHFSIFEVWDRISEEELKELEGLFRELYSRDTRAIPFNKQRRYKKLQSVNLEEWRFKA